MNHTTASGVTWSMTGGKIQPSRRQGPITKLTFSTRQCSKCGREYTPTGGKQRFCQDCAPRKRQRKAKTYATILDEAPNDVESVPTWLASEDWRKVESAWVALIVEQFGTDDNRGALAMALVNVRDRYRAEGGKGEQTPVKYRHTTGTLHASKQVST